MAYSITDVFYIVALIILLGFLGEQFFRRTKIPSFLFLILAGFVLGPVLGIINKVALTPFLAIIAEFTLLMVLFHGGMDLKVTSILKDGWRPVVQVLLYIGVSVGLISLFSHIVLGFSIPVALIFASIIGGETTTVIIIPLSRSLNLREKTIMFLTFEAALNSIILVVLFLTFVGLYQSGTASPYNLTESLVSQFSIGILVGLALSLIWIYILNYFKKGKYTYVLTLGFLLLTYSITNSVSGSGFLAVIIFGVVFGNHRFISNLMRRKINMNNLTRQIFTFHGEITFLMETLFFIFLGLVLSISLSSLYAGLGVGLALVLILMLSRYLAVNVSTLKSDIAKDKKIIFASMAQGLTPATLAILSINYGIQHANLFLTYVTYVIIITNIVTMVGTFIITRKANAAHPKK